MTNTQAWNYAVGMIKVDGLEPTPEFLAYIVAPLRIFLNISCGMSSPVLKYSTS